MAYRLGALLVGIFLLLEGSGFSRASSSDHESRSFSSEGRSAFNAGDLARSRSDAVKNMYENALALALSALVEPAALEARSAAVKSRIMRRSESYVQNYQVSSEGPEGEAYRIQGQVTVAMDALVSDLQTLGFRIRKPPPAEAGSEAQPSAEGDPTGEAVSERQGTGTTPGAESSTVADADPAAAPDLPRFKRRVLWAVAEKRDGTWHMSRDSDTPQDILARSMIQESEIYDISLLFPAEDAVRVDSDGAFAEKAAMASARTAETRAVVLGAVTIEPEGGRQRLKASLRLVNTATYLEYGEIRLERDIGDNGPEEAIMSMAGIVAARMDQLLRETPRPAPETAADTGVGADAGSLVSIGNVDSVTLVVRDYRQISNWEEIENMLRQDYMSLKIKELELGPGAVKAGLGGIDSQLPERLQHLRLRNGLQIQVKEYSAQDNTLDTVLVPGSTTRSEQ